MNQKEIDELEICINMIINGGSIDDCLAKFPNLSIEDLANLRAALAVFKSGDIQVPREAAESSQKQLLEQVARYEPRETSQSMNQSWINRAMQTFSRPFARRNLAGRMAMVIVITAVLVIFSGGLVITSAKSLPGDSLYPVKLAVEDIQLYLTSSERNKLDYESGFNQQRVSEIVKLNQLKRVEKISFEGVLVSKGTGQWIVSGINISILPDTTYVSGLTGKEEFLPGSLVEVEGSTKSMGGVDATEIHLRQYQLDGTVEKIDPKAWQVSGYKVPINSLTKIEDGIQIGDGVSVLIRSEDSGFFAVSIQIKGKPTPTTSSLQQQQKTPTHEQEDAEIIATDLHDPQHMISPEATETPEIHEQVTQESTPDIDSQEENISTEVPQHDEESGHQTQASTPEQHTPEPSEAHESEP